MGLTFSLHNDEGPQRRGRRGLHIDEVTEVLRPRLVSFADVADAEPLPRCKQSKQDLNRSTLNQDGWIEWEY